MRAPAAVSALRRRGDLDVLTWPAFDAFDVDVMVTTAKATSANVLLMLM